jgi:hypothetical protein
MVLLERVASIQYTGLCVETGFHFPTITGTVASEADYSLSFIQKSLES